MGGIVASSKSFFYERMPTLANLQHTTPMEQLHTMNRLHSWGVASALLASDPLHNSRT